MELKIQIIAKYLKDLFQNKLSFGSCESLSTPEKRLEALHSQMNGFLHQLRNDQFGNNRYSTGSICISNESYSQKPKEEFSPKFAKEAEIYSKPPLSEKPDHSRDLIKKRIMFLKQKLEKF